MQKEIFETLNTISDDTLDQALLKIPEGVDKDKGEVKWHETMTNLRSSRDLLLDLAQRNVISQIPLTIQKQINSDVQDLSKFFTELSTGTDTVVNIVNTTEALFTFIWENRLANLSDEYISYKTKENNLKRLETEAHKLRENLNKNLSLQEELHTLVGEAKKTKEEIDKKREVTEENAKAIQQNLENTNTISQTSSAKLTSITENEATIRSLEATSKASNTEITSLRTNIKVFFDEITQFKTDISDTKTKAEKSNEDGKKEVADFLKKYKDSFDAASSTFTEETNLEKERRSNTLDQNEKRLSGLISQMGDQLAKATGHTLFHAFEARRRLLVKSKWAWARIVYILFGCTGVWGLIIVFALVNNDPPTLLYLKFALSIPIAGGVWFALLQYSKERRLEEEYAYRSSISISLVPYRMRSLNFLIEINQRSKQNMRTLSLVQ